MDIYYYTVKFFIFMEKIISKFDCIFLAKLLILPRVYNNYYSITIALILLIQENSKEYSTCENCSILAIYEIFILS